MRILLLLLVLSLAACDTERGPALLISDIEVTRPLPGASMSAGYFLLENRTDEPMVITRIDSPQFGRVEMHETLLEDGISKMRRLGELRIAGRSSVRLERGGKHLMLMRPEENLSNISLAFYSGPDLVLSAVAPIAER